jgi:hypothetical protein
MLSRHRCRATDPIGPPPVSHCVSSPLSLLPFSDPVPTVALTHEHRRGRGTCLTPLPTPCLPPGEEGARLPLPVETTFAHIQYPRVRIPPVAPSLQPTVCVLYVSPARVHKPRPVPPSLFVCPLLRVPFLPSRTRRSFPPGTAHACSVSSPLVGAPSPRGHVSSFTSSCRWTARYSPGPLPVFPSAGPHAPSSPFVHSIPPAHHSSVPYPLWVAPPPYMGSR